MPCAGRDHRPGAPTRVLDGRQLRRIIERTAVDPSREPREVSAIAGTSAARRVLREAPRPHSLRVTDPLGGRSVSQGQSGSPFPPPDLDPLMSRGEEAAPTPAAAPRRGRRTLLVGVLLIFTVLAATLGTSAVLFSAHGGEQSSDLHVVSPLTVTFLRGGGGGPTGPLPPPGGQPALAFDITARSPGEALLILSGGAAFEDGLPLMSVRLHQGRTRITLPLSPSTKRGVYLLEVRLPGSAPVRRRFRVR